MSSQTSTNSSIKKDFNIFIKFFEEKFSQNIINIFYAKFSYKDYKNLGCLLVIGSTNLIIYPLQKEENDEPTKEITLKYEEVKLISTYNKNYELILLDYDGDEVAIYTIQRDSIVEQIKVGFLTNNTAMKKCFKQIKAKTFKHFKFNKKTIFHGLFTEEHKRLLFAKNNIHFYIYSLVDLPSQDQIYVDKTELVPYILNYDTKLYQNRNNTSSIFVVAKEYLKDFITIKFRGCQQFYIYYERPINKGYNLILNDTSRWRGIKLKLILFTPVKKQMTFFGFLRDYIPHFYNHEELYVFYSVCDFAKIETNLFFDFALTEKEKYNSNLQKAGETIFNDPDNIFIHEDYELIFMLYENALLSHKPLKMLTNKMFNNQKIALFPMGKQCLSYIYFILLKVLDIFEKENLVEKIKKRKEICFIYDNLSAIALKLKQTYPFLPQVSPEILEEEIKNIYGKITYNLSEPYHQSKLLFSWINGGCLGNYFNIDTIINLFKFNSAFFDFFQGKILDILLLNKPKKESLLIQYVSSESNLTKNVYYIPLLKKLITKGVLGELLLTKKPIIVYINILSNFLNLNDSFEIIDGIYKLFTTIYQNNIVIKSTRLKFFSQQFDVALSLITYLNQNSQSLSLIKIPTEIQAKVIKIITLVAQHSERMNLIELLIQRNIMTIIFNKLTSYDMKLSMIASELIFSLSKLMGKNHVIIIGNSTFPLLYTFDCLYYSKKLQMWDTVLNLLQSFNNFLDLEMNSEKNKKNNIVQQQDSMDKSGQNSSTQNLTREIFPLRDNLSTLILNQMKKKEKEKDTINLIIDEILLVKSETSNLEFEKSLLLDKNILRFLSFLCKNGNNGFKYYLFDKNIFPKLKSGLVNDDGFKSYFKYLKSCFEENKDKEKELSLLVELLYELIEFIYSFIKNFKLGYDEISLKTEYFQYYSLLDYIKKEIADPKSPLSILIAKNEINNYFQGLSSQIKKYIIYLEEFDM